MESDYDFSHDNIHQFLIHTPVLPVITLHCVDDALPLAEAFVEGGIRVLEITLRTPEAIAAIKAIKTAHPELVVGAGTVSAPEQFTEIKSAGADFAVSPGMTAALAKAAADVELPYLPGVSTVTEAMWARELGFHCLKLFPAETVGGVSLLKAMLPVLPDVKFVPTGGITTSNMDNYFDCHNVLSVGGSWIASQSLVDNQDWGVITELAQQVLHHQRSRLAETV